jgi:hypothetical protein
VLPPVLQVLHLLLLQLLKQPPDLVLLCCRLFCMSCIFDGLRCMICCILAACPAGHALAAPCAAEAAA